MGQSGFHTIGPSWKRYSHVEPWFTSKSPWALNVKWSEKYMKHKHEYLKIKSFPTFLCEGSAIQLKTYSSFKTWENKKFKPEIMVVNST